METTVTPQLDYFNSHSYSSGDTLEIEFDRNNPTSARIAEQGTGWLDLLKMIIPVAFLLTSGWAARANWKRMHPSRGVPVSAAS